MITDFIPALVIGLLGGAHCIGMCGGIMGALTMGIGTDQTIKRWLLIISYSVGRIASYVFIALLFYLAIASAENYFSIKVTRLIAGILLITMGLYVADWWRGLVYLEKMGGFLWRFLQPLSRRLLPVTHIKQALLLGMLWGWLPCGLVYSALVYSATASSWQSAGLTMLAFGLGTLPAILLGSLVAERMHRWLQSTPLKQIMGLLLIIFGLWTLFVIFQHGHPMSKAYFSL